MRSGVMAVSDRCLLSDEMRTLCYVVLLVDTDNMEKCFAPSSALKGVE